MKRSCSVFFLIMVHVALLAQTRKDDPALKLWYDKPAAIWEEALPLGNGKTGAMVFGGVNRERLQLNDNTLWSGYPNAGNNPKGPEALPKVRQAIEEENYGEAAALWKKNLQGPYSARYLPMADLFLDFLLKDSTVKNYRRELNLNNAIHTVSYEQNGIKFKRETLISFPDQALLIRLTADKKNAVSFVAGINSKLHYKTTAMEDGYLVLKGKAPKYVAHRNTDPQQIVYDDNGEGMTFEVHLKIKLEGGTAKANGDKIAVEGANAVTIYVTDATSFNGFDKSPAGEGKDPALEAGAEMNKAYPKDYGSIK